MLLTHAQGVSTSFEDAAALELFLADLPSPESVESAPSETLLQRLHQFEKFRLPRVSATQILTNPIVPGPTAAALHKEQEAEIRRYYSGPLPPTGAMPHTPPICQFFFGYDVRKEAVQFMQDNQVSTPPQPATPYTAPIAVPVQASTPVMASAAPSSQPAVNSVDQPASVWDGHSIAVYQEAQKALAAAQIALVQVTHTLAAAQNALDLATKSMKFTPPQEPRARYRSPPEMQRTTPSLPTAATQGQAGPSPPAKPRRLKSFDSMKSRMAAVGQKMSRVSVREKEVRDSSPDTLLEKQN